MPPRTWRWSRHGLPRRLLAAAAMDAGECLVGELEHRGLLAGGLAGARRYPAGTAISSQVRLEY